MLHLLLLKTPEIYSSDNEIPLGNLRSPKRIGGVGFTRLELVATALKGYATQLFIDEKKIIYIKCIHIVDTFNIMH
jgi:hypothetical protein